MPAALPSNYPKNYDNMRSTAKSRAASRKPGWVDVPGKGQRYWDGSKFTYAGPGTGATKNTTEIRDPLGAIAGAWSEFVNPGGKRTTSDPTKVGQQSWERDGLTKENTKPSPASEQTPQAVTPAPVTITRKDAEKDPKALPFGSLPASAAVPGTGPKGNEVRSDADPNEPGLQGPGDPKNAPPNGDPGGTGQTGMSMTYDNFMEHIGTPQDVKVANPFLSEKLPGTAEQVETLQVTNNQGDKVDVPSKQPVNVFGMNIDADLVNGRLIPKATINAAAGGQLETEMENDRQLVPGQSPEMGQKDAADAKITAKSKAKGRSVMRGMENDERFTNFGEDHPDTASLTGGISERGRAFLDAPNSAMGLRRAEGVMGVVAQGNKKFARDPQAEGGLREISQAAYRARMDGMGMEQAIANNPIAQAKSRATARKETPSGETGIEPAVADTPAVSQSPGVAPTSSGGSLDLPEKGMTHADIDALPKIPNREGVMVPDFSKRGAAFR